MRRLVSEAESSTFLEAGAAHSSEPSLFATAGHGIESVALALGAAVVLGWLLARGLRRAGLSWTWALLGLPVGYLAGGLLVGRWPIWIVSVIAAVKGSRLHDADLAAGGESAQMARSRDGVGSLLGSLNIPVLGRREGWIRDGRLTVGRTSRVGRARIPVGDVSGKHTLVVGATGSGKTVTQAWIAGRMIDCGHGAVVIDPKGDELLRTELRQAAARRDAEFIEWSSGRPGRLQPLCPWVGDRDRRQGALRRGVHRAALPAPGPAVPRARGPRDARRQSRRDAAVADGAHEPATARGHITRAARRARRRTPEVSGRAHRSAEERPRRDPRQALDPCRVRHRAMGRQPRDRRRPGHPAGRHRAGRRLLPP